MLDFDPQNEQRQVWLIDYNTKNKSFLTFHHALKEEGIENNTFFLRVSQEELLGVDVHDKSLSQEMKAMIMHECATNPWYYYREILHLVKPNNEITQFVLTEDSLNATVKHLEASGIDPQYLP